MKRTALAIVLFTLATTPTHAGTIYWSDQGNGNVLRRGNLDGSNVETVVPVGTNGVAFDPAAQQLYWGQAWIDDALFTLWRAAPDGSNPESLHEGLLFLPGPLALDPVQQQLFTGSFVGEGCDGIWRFPADGTGPGEQIVLECVDGLAVDVGARKLYWTKQGLPGGIARSDYDGSNVEVVLDFNTQVVGLALDEARGKLYWTEVDTPNAVLRADASGENIEVLVESPEDCHAVALDLVAGNLYYTLEASGGGQVIYRATLDGSNPQPILAVESRAQLALDPTPTNNVPASSPTGIVLLVVAMLLLARRRLHRNAGSL